MISLVKDTIDNKDIDRLINWLKTYPKLTKGQITLDFESKFSKWLGRKYSVFCNSGSSANLLMLSVLKEKYDLQMKDLEPYLPPSLEEYKSGPEIEFHYLGYYVKWIPQEAYYYAVEKSNIS